MAPIIQLFLRRFLIATTFLLSIFVAVENLHAERHLQAAAGASPPALALQIDAEHCAVHWTLDSTLHTVHGTFSVKSGSFHFDPATGDAGGEIVVAATSGVSGNDSRDKKMHNDVLESAKFPDITFRPDHVQGKIVTQGPQDLQLHGKFILHGVEHEMTIPVHADFNGTQWSGTATFKIPFVEWRLKDPSNFLLKVNKEVEIELSLKGKLGSP
jgi:polyisoprenoid-binding protein YceI